MYLEIKAVISGIAIVLIFFVISQIIVISVLLAFLLFAGVFAFIFSDILIGIKITNTDANLWFDPLPQGTKELCILQTLSGLIVLVPVVKGVKGIRYGVLHKKKIAVINEGDGQFHTKNGNLGFFAHENYDKNINLKECKALEHLDGDDIKEIYRYLNSRSEEKKRGKEFKWSSKKIR